MENYTNMLASMGIVAGIIGLAIAVFMIITMWKIFVKAGQPGWAILVPIYNLLVLLKVAGKPWWWIFAIILPVIPIIGGLLYLVVLIFIFHGISKNFGKEAGFTVGLILLGFVFFPILAFGSAQYVGPKAA